MKRTRSTASSDALKKVGRATSEDSSSEFNRVLADLTKYQEVISAILPFKEEDNLPFKHEEENERGLEEISVTAEVNDLPTDEELEESIMKLVKKIITISNNYAQ